MIQAFPEAAGEFLQHYARDARYRWTSEDLAAQEEFVGAQTRNLDWLDWSSEAAAMQLMQAKLLATQWSAGGLREAILLAGPLVELLDPAELFVCAAANLLSGGRLVGITPCLRDNSPESQRFAQLAGSALWPYYSAEELFEMMREAGFSFSQDLSRFVTVSRFNQAVLQDELAFKGFREIFGRLEAEGYDPMEVGWGEIRFVATVDECA